MRRGLRQVVEKRRMPPEPYLETGTAEVTNGRRERKGRSSPEAEASVPADHVRFVLGEVVADVAEDVRELISQEDHRDDDRDGDDRDDQCVLNDSLAVLFVDEIRQDHPTPLWAHASLRRTLPHDPCPGQFRESGMPRAKLGASVGAKRPPPWRLAQRPEPHERRPRHARADRGPVRASTPAAARRKWPGPLGINPEASRAPGP